MAIEVRVPQLPESVADATLVTWHKQAGDSVARDENLADLETDKVVLEVPAPVAGVIKSLGKVAGTTVTSGELLATIDEQATGASVKPAAKAEKPEAASKAEAKRAIEPKKSEPAPTAKEEPGGKLSPAARRLVEENKLSAGEISGSGRDGRITKTDVAQHLESGQPARAPAGSRHDQRVPMSRLRARIAQRLVEAQATQALLTTLNEAA